MLYRCCWGCDRTRGDVSEEAAACSEGKKSGENVAVKQVLDDMESVYSQVDIGEDVRRSSSHLSLDDDFVI